MSTMILSLLFSQYVIIEGVILHPFLFQSYEIMQ